MKKLYSLALACAVTLSASAVRPVKGEIKTTRLAQSVEFKQEAAGALAKVKKAPASRAEANIDDVTGSMDWSYYDLMYDGAYSDEFTITVTDAKKGEVTFNLMEAYDIPFTFKGTIDVEAGTFSIPNKQKIGTDSDGDIYFFVTDFTIEGEEINETLSKAASVLGTIDGETVTFTENQIWYLGDPDNAEAGFYMVSAFNVFSKAVPWEDLGKASIVENITYSFFNEADNTKALSTNIKKKEGQMYFCVENPLQATYTLLEFNGASPALYFDATDPDNVIVEFCSTGINVGEDYGILEYACSAFLEDMVEGTLTVTKITLTHEDDQWTLTAPNKSLMLYAPAAGSLYWCPGETTIKFTMPADAAGIENVAVSEDAPVEYFNLQGMRVANPEAGIFIRRQGSNTSKVRL